jgi:hypothetical protein
MCSIFINFFFGGKKMKKCVMLLVVLAVSGICSATVLNDFESYATTPDLLAEWTTTANLTLSLNTTEFHDGAKSMKYSGNTWNSPWYTKSEHILDGVVWGVSGQNWTGMTTFSMWVKPTASYGCFKVSLVDCYGNNAYLMNWGRLATGSWIELTWDLTGLDAYGGTLTAGELATMGRIDIVSKKETAFDSASADGTNTYYVDGITVVPEPATIAVLSLGGLLLRRRK